MAFQTFGEKTHRVGHPGRDGGWIVVLVLCAGSSSGRASP
jgi:hypothetical protein